MPATRLTYSDPLPRALLQPQIVACSTLDIYAIMYDEVFEHLLVFEGVNCESH